MWDNENFGFKLPNDNNTIPRWIHSFSSCFWSRKGLKTGYENNSNTDNYKMIARLFDIFDEIGFD